MESQHAFSDIPLRPRPHGCQIPLTPMQLMQWNYVNKQPGGWSIRLRAASIRVLGPLNAHALEESIDAVVQRHESLRTRIVRMEGILRQIVDTVKKYELEVVDLTGACRREIEDAARQLAQQFVEKRIDLSVGPLFGVKLLRLSSQEHVLIVGLDHIVTDGFSNGILNREIWARYNQVTQRTQTTLPALPVQFPDYAVWQEHTHNARRLKHQAFWQKQLNCATSVEVPPDKGLIAGGSNVGVMLNLPFGKVASDMLRDLSRRERILLPVAVMVAHLIVMSHWCGQAYLTVPFMSHGRHHRAELQNMIGFLAVVLFIRIEISKTERLIDLLRRLHVKFMSAIEHQEFAPELPEKFSTELLFNWGGLPGYSTRWSVGDLRTAASALRIVPYPVRDPWSHKFLALYSDSPAGIVATVNYRPDLLARGSVERFGENLRTVTRELASHPHARLESIALTGG